jgi:prolyl oligopeptidase
VEDRRARAKEAIESVGVHRRPHRRAVPRRRAEPAVDVRPDGAPLGDVALPGTGTWARSADADDRRRSGTRSPRRCAHHRFTLRSRAGTEATFEAATPPVDASAYETQALFATSKDGTQVPLFVTAKKGWPGRQPPDDGLRLRRLLGEHAAAYRPDVPAWLERGGIWVTVSMRGGAEYGEAWHQAGMLEKKQNVFDDFIAALEFLVREKYTSPARLGIMGDSNGGLLVGAVMEQRPDLIAVALPGVGVMDMLRFDSSPAAATGRPSTGRRRTRRSSRS